MKQVYCIWILVFLLISSCRNDLKQAKEHVEEQNREMESPISFSSLSNRKVDTVSLRSIVDTVFYIALDHKKLNTILQVDYHDSLLFINDSHSILIFNPNGKLLRTIPLEYGSMDIDPHQSNLYTYQFANKILAKYSFLGNKEWSTRVKGKEMGHIGYYFASISDSLFAIANMNLGYNSDQLVFINNKGQIVRRLANWESFDPPKMIQTYKSSWKRYLFRNEDKVLYHPFYKDTVYEIRGEELEPVIIEQCVEKVPLEQRLEYMGKSVTDFTKYCMEADLYATRFYVTSRYVIVEYQLGSLENSLSNYLVYDKKTQKIEKTYNNLVEAIEKTDVLHFGIENDYDGGLAFQPMFQTKDYLIMVDAGEGYGKKSASPSELYRVGRKVAGKHYTCMGQKYKNQFYKERADHFFTTHKDDRTLLTVVKLKE